MLWWFFFKVFLDFLNYHSFLHYILFVETLQDRKFSLSFIVVFEGYLFCRILIFDLAKTGSALNSLPIFITIFTWKRAELHDGSSLESGRNFEVSHGIETGAFLKKIEKICSIFRRTNRFSKGGSAFFFIFCLRLFTQMTLTT